MVLSSLVSGHGDRVQLLQLLQELYRTHKEGLEQIDDVWIDLKADGILRNADIIGVTTTGLSQSRKMLSRVGSKVMVSEEAGEILEAQMLAGLVTSIQHLIMIGDHQQLRPHINEWRLSSNNPQGRQYSLDISLFERLLTPTRGGMPGLPFDTLHIQRRMHPAISTLVRSTIYPQLRDADVVKEYPGVAGMQKRLYWFHHNKPEGGSRGEISFSNSFEIEVIKSLLAYIVRQNQYSDGDIAILTPYASQ
ncbi:P-loop containing nucleoside triphosphate hydrolase protein, partial [Xylariales sp. PMI_506]